MSLIDDIIETWKKLAELPKPEFKRIIVVRYGVPSHVAWRWTKHDGILWIQEEMYAKLRDVCIVPGSAPMARPFSAFMGIPIEQYVPEVHGELWLEFLRDLGSLHTLRWTP